jgi:2-polyprenyl-3-methyl-5-hydroxy-6-metoxy-1,4-benzoquinol methylase
VPVTLETCPLCGSALVRRRRSVLWRCTGCALLLRNPLPTEDDLRALYASAWREPEHHHAETGGTDARLARIYVERLASDLGVTTFDGSSVVDFGAGRGELARALREAGASVTAIDPFSFETLRGQGFDAYARVEDLPPGLRFDGAVTMDVVEHLEAAWEPLAAVGEHLRPGGWLFVSTVNPYGLNATLLGDRWRELRKPGHIVFFGSRAAEAMLRRSGYASPRRLHWHVGYHTGTRAVLERLLVGARAEGALRYLAFRAR